MTRVVFGVREEDALKWAIRLMVDEHVHRVAVTDRAGHLVGIVTAMDVLRAIAPEKRTDLGFEYVDLSTKHE
jgi:CBS domain-containing protein